ncbi:hypothetical protein WH47_06918 [Habropoda laboriosa]|uniref:DDE-1 domain-containing protein n=1 Tax=Habropoda laboriosa TaxID=597456 RepID=A0A0L7QQ66_9HYME|nr:hypothetical protein WH47_06918 [Habropoda laboriosa]
MDETNLLWKILPQKTLIHEGKLQVEGKVILLVHNFKEHKRPESATESEHYKLIFLPLNTTANLQLMDQGVIAKCN